MLSTKNRNLSMMKNIRTHRDAIVNRTAELTRSTKALTDACTILFKSFNLLMNSKTDQIRSNLFDFIKENIPYVVQKNDQVDRLLPESITTVLKQFIDSAILICIKNNMLDLLWRIIMDETRKSRNDIIHINTMEIPETYHRSTGELLYPNRLKELVAASENFLTELDKQLIILEYFFDNKNTLNYLFRLNFFDSQLKNIDNDMNWNNFIGFINAHKPYFPENNTTNYSFPESITIILRRLIAKAILACFSNHRLDLLEGGHFKLISVSADLTDLQKKITEAFRALFNFYISKDFFASTAEYFEKFFKIAGLAKKSAPNERISLVNDSISNVYNIIYNLIRSKHNENSLFIMEIFFNFYKSFDQNNAVRLLEAETFCRLEQWNIAFQKYSDILENRFIDKNTKGKASFEIANILIMGLVHVQNPAIEDGVACKEIPTLEPSDDQKTQKAKNALKEGILIARALQAYEYIVRAATINLKFNYLLEHAHRKLAGLDKLTANDENPQWLPEAIRLFGLYYKSRIEGPLVKEYNYQRKLLEERMNNSASALVGSNNPGIFSAAPSQSNVLADPIKLLNEPEVGSSQQKSFLSS